jgi:ABC-2 type transport system ATP-binding protein
MHQVEELCDRILLIDDGRNVIYGPLDKIRRDYSGHAVLVQVQGSLPTMTGVKSISQENGALHLTLEDDVSPQDILTQLVGQNMVVEQFEIATPTLDEIFIRTVRDKEVG